MTVYRACTDRDIPALQHIWLRCFDEREDAAELFFQRCRSSYHAYACEADGMLVSALYLIDCSLSGDRAHYLCGAATLPAYRSRGMMAGLIAYALEDAARRGDRFSLLFPAQESLYGYYARFGYLPACAVKHLSLTTDTDAPLCGGQSDLVALQAARAAENAVIWQPDFIRFAADYYACYGAKTAQSADAFAVFQPDGDRAEVHFAYYRDFDALKALLAAEDVVRFRLTAPAACPLTGETVRPYGMILPLCGDTPPADAFIGVTLQ